jgi:hypothetical protein
VSSEAKEEKIMSNETGVAGTTIVASDVRFFWAEGVSTPAYDRWYHWLVDCPEVLVATWYGAKVVSSDTPPPDAGDVDHVKGLLEEHLGSLDWPNAIIRPRGEPPKPGLRWLCRICDLYLPAAVAAPHPPETEPCLKCGCGREIHISCRGPFDRGCGMAWTEAIFDEDGRILQASLNHCPCDGYEPPIGGRPITPADFVGVENLWSHLVPGSPRSVDR